MHTEISITPQELQRRIASGSEGCLLDVRTPAEYSGVHIPGTTLIPLDELDPKTFSREHAGDSSSITVICQSGGRARKAVGKTATRRDQGLHSSGRWNPGMDRRRISGKPGKNPGPSTHATDSDRHRHRLSHRALSPSLSIHALHSFPLSPDAASSSPESPAFAAWLFSWPECHGTKPFQPRGNPAVPHWPDETRVEEPKP